MIQAIRDNIAETERLLLYARLFGIRRWPFETNASLRKRLISEHRNNKGNILSYARFMLTGK